MEQTKAAPRLMMDANGAVVALKCDHKCPLALIIEAGGHLMTVIFWCYRYSFSNLCVNPNLLPRCSSTRFPLYEINFHAIFVAGGRARRYLATHNVECCFEVMHVPCIRLLFFLLFVLAGFHSFPTLCRYRHLIEEALNFRNAHAGKPFVCPNIHWLESHVIFVLGLQFWRQSWY